MNVTGEQLYEEIGRLHVACNLLQAQLNAALASEQKLVAEVKALTAILVERNTLAGEVG
jgi:DNA anti-recombination protein RmuC